MKYVYIRAYLTRPKRRGRDLVLESRYTDQPAEKTDAADQPEKKTAGGRWFDALIALGDNIPWFKTLRAWVAANVPDEYRKPLLCVIALLAVALTVWIPLQSTLVHLVQEVYGPDVVIGVTEPQTAKDERFGEKSLLYEFVFHKKQLAHAIQNNGDVRDQFSQAPAVTINADCEVEMNKTKMRILRLILIAQNSGHKTATGYEMMVTFSSQDQRSPDPGVRILGQGTDALTVDYRYMQESNETIKSALASCEALKPFYAELTAEEKPKQNSDSDKSSGPAPIPAITRATYQSMGLTRDLIILKGTLEAHLFQAATVVIAVPATVDKFATIFHVACENCSWFYKTNSYSQVVEIGPVAAPK